MLTRVLPKALPTSASLHHRQPVSECFSVSIVLRLLQIHFRLWSSNSQVACRKLFKKPTTAGPTVLDRQCWRQLGTKAAKKSKIIKSKLWKVQNSCLGPRLSRFLAFANVRQKDSRQRISFSVSTGSSSLKRGDSLKFKSQPSNGISKTVALWMHFVLLQGNRSSLNDARRVGTL